MGVVSIGVDIGQRRDPSAICVAEQLDPAATGVLPPFVVRHLERLKLGTDYSLVAERVADVVAGVMAQTAGVAPRVRLDATGVGRPVCELVATALRQRRVPSTIVEFCVFTYGERSTLVEGERRVGKAFLVSRLQALLQTRRLQLPRTAEAAALAEELQTYEIKVDPDGDAKFGAFKVGKHDDLVTALGLAVLEDMPIPIPMPLVLGAARGWQPDSPSGRMNDLGTAARRGGFTVQYEGEQR